MAKTRKPKIEVIQEVPESHKFKERMSLLNNSYEKLQLDKGAWNKELIEREELEGTLMDGLENELPSNLKGIVKSPRKHPVSLKEMKQAIYEGAKKAK